MEKIVEQGKLFDLYGEMLNEHQQAIYSDAVFENMSLSELAETYDVTRQAAHDLLKRCDKKLSEYESRLHLVKKLDELQKINDAIASKCDEMKELLHNIDCSSDSVEVAADSISRLTDKLDEMKKLTESVDSALWE